MDAFTIKWKEAHKDGNNKMGDKMSKYNDRDLIRFKEISDKLMVFGPKLIQDFLTLLNHIQTSEISLGAFKSWVNYQRTEGGFSYGYANGPEQENKYKCPECNSSLELMDVNNTNCTQVGGEAMSLFTCEDIFECGYELYSPKSAIYWRTLLLNIGNEAASKIVVKKSACGGCGK